MRSRRYRLRRKSRKRRGGAYYKLNRTPMYFTDVSHGGGDGRYVPLQPAVNMLRGVGHGISNTVRDLRGSYHDVDPDVLSQPLGKKYV